MTKPRLLLLALRDDWLGPPRMAMALRKAGLPVAGLCPAEGPLAVSAALEQRFLFSREQPPSLDLIVQAVRDWQPARLLAMDDAAVLLLRRLTRLPQLPAPLPTLLAAGGDPARLADWLDKDWAARAARQAGLAVPDWRLIEAGQSPGREAARLGAPLILKPLVGFGGQGTRRIAADELPDRLPAAPRPQLLQRYVEGQTWAFGFFAEEGRLLAGFGAAKERVHPALVGPSARIRIAAQPALRAAAGRLLAARRYSGFGSLDFQLDAQGQAWFLECNPRPSPLLHLGARAGPDPAAALADNLHGREHLESPLRRPDWPVALWPQEQLRDPAGSDLGDAEWDRPDDDPPLRDWLQRRLIGPR